jgi:hypothetical protein
MDEKFSHEETNNGSSTEPICSNLLQSGSKCKGLGPSGLVYSDVLELLRPTFCLQCESLLGLLRTSWQQRPASHDQHQCGPESPRAGTPYREMSSAEFDALVSSDEPADG